ncbi:hypothetical protein SLS60_005619 [Paraconiothyrium brasiliense]|uniref:NmrA-like domain-containing protein n=1 Tax=Paraconiothyrium brasiliense TaxID=300254 RepID=A0ABR3RI59_9PLEO
MPWWEGKGKVRKYLKELNESRKVLEYCLFQPGLFLDYLAFPHKTSKHLNPLGTVFDFQNSRAITVDGYESAVITLTTVTDFATSVAKTIEYEGEWPEVDRPFAVEKVKLEDLEKDILTSSWGLEVPHKAVSAEAAEQMLKQVTIGMLLSTAKGAWEGSDEINQLFPEYRFTPIENFLARVWHDSTSA